PGDIVVIVEVRLDLRIQKRACEEAVWLRKIDGIGSSWQMLLRSLFSKVAAGIVDIAFRIQMFYFDALAQQNFYGVGQTLRILAGEQVIGADRTIFSGLDGCAAEVVKVAQAVCPMLDGGINRCQRRGEVAFDAVAKGECALRILEVHCNPGVASTCLL